MTDMNVIPVIPIQESANGKTNAYYHLCNAVGCKRAYALCLHLIEQQKAGTINSDLYGDCDGYIAKKTCPAIKMSQEELIKGQAIYFIPRNEWVKDAPSSQTYSIGYQPIQRELERKLPPPAPVRPMVDAGSFADAINTATQEATPRTVVQPPRKAEVVEPVIPEVKPQPKAPREPMLPGETPLEYARRVMGKK